MDTKGEPVAHAHDDRVGLVPFVFAKIRKNLAMLVGRGHQGARLHQRSGSPLQKTSTFSPNAPRAKVTSPVFSSICAQALASCPEALASPRSSAPETTLSICVELTFGSLDTTR